MADSSTIRNEHGLAIVPVLTSNSSHGVVVCAPHAATLVMSVIGTQSPALGISIWGEYPDTFVLPKLPLASVERNRSFSDSEPATDCSAAGALRTHIRNDITPVLVGTPGASRSEPR